MSRRGILGIVAVVGMLGVGAGVARGGATQLFPLQVNAAARFANAGLAETHNTADTTQYAECGTNGSTGYCTFRDRRTGQLYYAPC